MNDNALHFDRKSIGEVIELAIREMKRAGLPYIEKKDILFTDGQFWKELGTIISPEPYVRFRESMLQPSGRIRLAGDYTYWTARSMIPYGMTPAAVSGRNAAQAVKDKLK